MWNQEVSIEKKKERKKEVCKEGREGGRKGKTSKVKFLFLDPQWPVREVYAKLIITYTKDRGRERAIHNLQPTTQSCDSCEALWKETKVNLFCRPVWLPTIALNVVPAKFL